MDGEELCGICKQVSGREVKGMAKRKGEEEEEGKRMWTWLGEGAYLYAVLKPKLSVGHAYDASGACHHDRIALGC